MLSHCITHTRSLSLSHTSQQYRPTNCQCVVRCCQASVCAFDKHARHVVTAGNDNVAIVWDVFNSRQVFTLEGHTASVKGCAFSPTNQQIATASFDATVIVWNADGGRKLAELSGHDGWV
jgi:WD40 repeat protein